MKETIDILAAPGNQNDKAEKEFEFKNNPPFWSNISKINNTLIDNADDTDSVMPMHNLLEYSHNYSITSRSLWDYYREKIDNVNPNNRLDFSRGVFSG